MSTYSAYRYLEAFSEPFGADRLLPRLFSRLTQVDALTAALNVELGAFHSEDLRADAQDDGSEDDVRYFLWDFEAEEPSFQIGRALTLFARIGIVKPDLAPETIAATAEPSPKSLSRKPSCELVRQLSDSYLSVDEIDTPVHMP